VGQGLQRSEVAPSTSVEANSGVGTPFELPLKGLPQEGFPIPGDGLGVGRLEGLPVTPLFASTEVKERFPIPGDRLEVVDKSRERSEVASIHSPLLTYPQGWGTPLGVTPLVTSTEVRGHS
jgi:hypothetical protein